MAGPDGRDEGADDVVEIRPVETREEREACVALQRGTWGEDFEETVSAGLIQVTQKVGAVVLGAYHPEADLVGFVYGLTGYVDGEPVHWSHMLAVRESFRNRGIGRRLKGRQREWLRGRGIHSMRWTFDPLEARNAQLNLNVLGAEITEFVPNMYGRTGSVLHTAGTDRFVVLWRLDEEADGAGTSTDGVAWSAVPLVDPLRVVEGTPNGLVPEGPVRVEIPGEFQSLSSRARARWRSGSRRVFREYMGRGYRVVGFRREVETGRCFYLIRSGGGAE